MVNKRFKKVIKVIVIAVVLFSSSLLLVQASHAMPSFTRQTGMDCNSCHIGTAPVPSFTHTGRLFALRGYTRPLIRERIKTNEGGEPAYGGDYLALNLNPFWSWRLTSTIVSQSKSASSGEWGDATTFPASRIAMFYTGPITEWLGIWNEVGYLGNRSLRDVDGQRTNLNDFAYDEFRLSFSRDMEGGESSFWGMSLGNEMPYVVTQFVFPIGMGHTWGHGQGGAGAARAIGTFSFHALWNERYWTQYAIVSGGDNLNLSDGVNQYINIAYNAFRKQKNSLWGGLELYFGTDEPPLVRRQSIDFISCRTNAVDASGNPATCTITADPHDFSYGSGSGFPGADNEVVDSFFSFRLKADHSAADRGPHSWLGSVNLHGNYNKYKSGNTADFTVVGANLRYFYKRTYGFEVFSAWTLQYDYKKDGTTYKLDDVPTFGSYLIWNPAMNVNFNLRISTSQITTSSLTPNREQKTGGLGYSLGMEYSF